MQRCSSSRAHHHPNGTSRYGHPRATDISGLVSRRFTGVSAASFRCDLFAACSRCPPGPSPGSTSAPRVPGAARAPPPGGALNGRSLAPPLFLISANPRPASCNSSGGSVPLPQGAGEERESLGAFGGERRGAWCPFSATPVAFALSSPSCSCPRSPPRVRRLWSRRFSPLLPFSPVGRPKGRAGKGGSARAVGGAAAARAAKVRARRGGCSRPSRGGQGRAGPAPLHSASTRLQPPAPLRRPRAAA